MAQIDADKRDYVSLAALREGNGGPEAPSPALAILQDGLLAGARIGLVGSRVMPASEK